MPRRIKKNINTNYFDIIKMSEKQQIDTLAQLNKRANTRIRALVKAGYANEKGAYGKIKKYMDDIGVNALYQGKKHDVKSKEFKRALLEVTTFLGYESSTVGGNKAIEKRRFNTFAKNTKLIDKLQETYPDKSRKEIIAEHKDKFFEFVRGNQFKSIRKLIDSDQIMDDFVAALLQGETIDEINKDYMSVSSGEITFDKMQEKKKRAAWQQAQRRKNTNA